MFTQFAHANHKHIASELPPVSTPYTPNTTQYMHKHCSCREPVNAHALPPSKHACTFPYITHIFRISSLGATILCAINYSD